MDRTSLVDAKMCLLLALTGGLDMTGTEFRQGYCADGDTYQLNQIRAVGYRNGTSLWASLNRYAKLGRYVYRAPETESIWIDESVFCWRDDFLRAHADVVPFDDRDMRGETWDTIEAMAEIRADRQLRNAFMRMRQWQRGERLRVDRYSILNNLRRRNHRSAEAFAELAQIAEFMQPVGRSPNGFLGRVWNFDARRHDDLVCLIVRPLEAYVAKRGPRLIWDRDVV